MQHSRLRGVLRHSTQRFRRGVAAHAGALQRGALPQRGGSSRRLADELRDVDVEGRNRGLRFDWEMVPYCDSTMVVHSRVNRIINEATGRMMEFSNPCIVLEGGVCRSRFSGSGRINCPRAIYSYWRENWLERLGEPERSVTGREGE